MSKGLTFIFIVFMMAKFYFKKFYLKKPLWRHLIKLSCYWPEISRKPSKLNWFTEKLRQDCSNFSILKEKLWKGKIYPPPWRIGLNDLPWDLINREGILEWIYSIFALKYILLLTEEVGTWWGKILAIWLFSNAKSNIRNCWR